jgi:hypothetical protein
MTRLTSVLFLIMTAVPVFAQDKPGIPPFVIYYSVVEHVLKHDQGCSQQLLDSSQRKNISDFWYGYAVIKCNDYFKEQAGRISKQYTEKNGTLMKKQADDEMERIREQCITSVIFDNWERINSTIVKNPSTQCSAVGKQPK